MPVRRDPRTKRWFFRATVKLPDGTRRRVFGTPGVPGPYQDLSQSKVGAQEAERRAIAEAMTGKPAALATSKEVPTPTIKEYAIEFMRSYKPEQKPSERRGKQLIIDNQLAAHFGHLRLDALRQEHVGAFVAAQLAKPVKPKTINNRLAVLSSLIKYAVTNGVISKPKGLKFKIAAMRGGVVAVPMADVDQLVAAATDPVIRVGVLLAAEAGLRTGEIRGLQWTDIKDGEITIRRALDTDTGEVITPKHDKTRTVPLSDRLVDELRALARRGLWVLTLPDGLPLSYREGGGLYERILALYAAAGVSRPPKPIHCLRHTFGTELAARGVPLPVIQELMGHAMIETTRQYIHVNDQQKRGAIADAFSRGSHVAARKRKPRKS